MALNLNKQLKTYYNIKEVAQMIGVSEPTLRYWETEFTHLRPKTSANKVRQYTEKNIEDIKVVYNLIKVRGFKISAARKLLSANRKPVETTSKVIEKLQKIKGELEEIKVNLDMMT